MALRHLFLRTGRARALGLLVRESFEGPFHARTITSSQCCIPGLPRGERNGAEEFCTPTAPAGSRGFASSASEGSQWMEAAPFWEQLDCSCSRDSESAAILPLSALPDSNYRQQGFFSNLIQRLPLTTINNNCHTSTSSSFHIRHHSTAAVEADPATNSNINPAVAMHREQFLRAASRKVVKPQPVIRAYARELCGKNPNKKERKQGLVPGIVFSGKGGHKGGDKRLISVGHKQLAAILAPLGKFFFSAMTWELEVYDGRPGEEATVKKTVERVVPKSVHLHAATDEPMNVTFMRVVPEETITVDVPLVFLGEDACPGLKKGGRLNTLRRLVRYECPGNKIPPYLEVDISTLNIGQSVRLRDLPADPALRLTLKDPDWLVVKISGRTQDDESTKEGS